MHIAIWSIVAQGDVETAVPVTIRIGSRNSRTIQQDGKARAAVPEISVVITVPAAGNSESDLDGIDGNGAGKTDLPGVRHTVGVEIRNRNGGRITVRLCV